MVLFNHKCVFCGKRVGYFANSRVILKVKNRKRNESNRAFESVYNVFVIYFHYICFRGMIKECRGELIKLLPKV